MLFLDFEASSTKQAKYISNENLSECTSSSFEVAFIIKTAMGLSLSAFILANALSEPLPFFCACVPVREEASDPFFAERGLSLASRSLSNAKTTTSTTSLARVLSPSLRIGNDGRTTFGRRTVSGAAGKHVNQPSNPADGRSARDGRTDGQSHKMRTGIR